MQVIRNVNHIKNSLPKLTLTIGNFDGVHMGHQKIIHEVKKLAKETNTASAIITFEPHPKAFFCKEKLHDFRITSLSQKLKIFQDYAIDYVIILPFTQTLANIEGKDFVEEILIKKLNLANIIIGYDFTFGKNKSGNIDLLRNYPFNIIEIAELKEKDAQTYSSSMIRSALKNGDIAKANECLGRPFSILGLVNHGKKLARQLNAPTANIKAKPHIIKQKFGVYKSITHIPSLQLSLPSITNFGIKPTIENQPVALFENHILHFAQDIYGKKIHIEFLEFIRDEKKFDSIESLKQQIQQDIASL